MTLYGIQIKYSVFGLSDPQSIILRKLFKTEDEANTWTPNGVVAIIKEHEKHPPFGVQPASVETKIITFEVD